MVYNKVKPILEPSGTSDQAYNGLSLAGSTGLRENSTASSEEYQDLDSISTVQLEESSFLKLKPFSRLDPSLVRLLRFLQCFGLIVNSDLAHEAPKKGSQRRVHMKKGSSGYMRLVRVTITLAVAILTSEVVYDVNLRQSKLLAEQKRSTPLLTFVIVAYSWLTLVIPLICDISLIMIGPYLFRFYSRTTATVCNGIYFGRKTSVDTWYYYSSLCLFGLLDVVGQVVLLGVWPSSINAYMMMFTSQDRKSVGVIANLVAQNGTDTQNSQLSDVNSSILSPVSNVMNRVSTVEEFERSTPESGGYAEPRINAYLLDSILGETYAHSDIGVCIKIICLVIQAVHSYSFLIIIVSLADHYATVINSINDNLDKYEFRRLLKQLIILRDSSEQISLMISIPFSLIIMLVFMRQIALNGVFIQSTMQPYENWAVALQSFTCSVSIFMVFVYCDGLQSASKQTHRLKTEQTVINENRGGNQSIYEFLDYLDRLSKSIRITFFNIIAINKSSLVGLYGHILTLTFVTS